MHPCRHRCAILLYLALAAVASVGPAGSIWALEVEPLGVGRGLDARVIASLLVDRRGFLWVGSREGLYRYDGYQAVRFIPEEGNPDSITDADIRMVFEDSAGMIWVATNNGGLNQYDPLSGRFRSFRHDSAAPNSMSNDSIYGMADSGDGKLWVGSQIGLNLLDPHSGDVRRFLHDPDDPESLSNDYVYAIHVDHAGSVWITTNGGGVNRWLPERQGFQRFDFSTGLGGEAALNDVFTVSETGDGLLWFGTRAGLVRLDPENGALEKIELAEDGNSELTITDSVLDGDGRLWLTALSEGVLIYDTRTGEVTMTDVRPQGNRGKLPAVPVISIALNDSLVFVGTWGSGIYAGWLNAPDFRLLGLSSEDDDPRRRNITAILTERDDGAPWVGSFGGGLAKVDVDSGATLPGASALDGVQSPGLLALTRTGDGRLFAASSIGLLEFTASMDSVILHEHDPNASDSLGPGYVTELLEDMDGGLWVGVGGSGLYFLPADGEPFVSYSHDPENPASLSGDYITAMLQTEPGKIWVGTRSQGLNHCSTKPFHCVRYLPDPGQPDGLGHFHVTDVYQGFGGDLWVTTDGGGFNRIRISAAGEVVEFERWGSKDGLISDAAVSIVQDDDDTLWVGTLEGLSRFDPHSGRFQNFVGHAGLPVTHFNVNAATRDRRYLYFGSIDGVLAVPVGSPFTNQRPSQINLNNIAVPANVGAGGPTTGLSESYSMPYGGVVSVGFSVLDFAEVPHLYEYQLNDTGEWISLGSKQDITFFGLAPGLHVLRTRGRDIFGSWSEATPFHIIVVPPFWMTHWFRAVLVLLLVLFVVSAHLARTAVLRRRNAELQRLKGQREQALESAQKSQSKLKEAYEGLRGLTGRLESAKEEERQSISRELHDEMGQMLTASKLNLQMARKSSTDPAVVSRLDDSVVMMDSMIQQVRDISLNLRPPLLDEAGLVPALRHYLGLMQERSGIRIPLEVGPGVSGNEPAVRTVAFRVVQEAVSNALRHAGASEIRVDLRLEGEQLCVLIEDNGTGFDPAEIQRRIRRGEHLGLLGMVERVHGIGGEFDVVTSPGKGSRISVKIPR